MIDSRAPLGVRRRGRPRYDPAQKPVRKVIYQAIVENRGMTRREITQVVGISQQLFSYHWQRMDEDGYAIFVDDKGEIGPRHGLWPISSGKYIDWCNGELEIK